MRKNAVQFFMVGVLSLGLCIGAAGSRKVETQVWPTPSKENRPWCYWWWMGSAVDKPNITSQLEAYRKAGLGGVHIIPIYGAKGYESRYIEYLSPAWMEMLRYTIIEAQRLDMGVDMTLGTGWCFGGPTITDSLANATVKYKVENLAGLTTVRREVNPALQTLMAYGPDGQTIELTDTVKNGAFEWAVPKGDWQLYQLWQQPSGQKVKRAAPGGAGHMLNPFSREAIEVHLQRFDAAFSAYQSPLPRAFYHDSYEYQCNWSPELFQEFQKRRGYHLQDHLPALLDKTADREQASRVKADYRRTLSEMMTENFTQTWTGWARAKGALTRNQAHGSPANLLDLYGQADCPETEFFHGDRNPLVSKFASSAAHTMGRKLVSSETGTWLEEHFQVSLGHLKPVIDGLFVSGVNHVFYHGTCYSPDDAAWPGWVFYASTQMNPRNSIWKDAPALNAYIARCQSVLQSGRPDNDVLLYWPIHDLWSDANGMQQNLSIHGTGWLAGQPIGKTAMELWKRGYAFDYVSDRQLAQAKAASSEIVLPGGHYDGIVVPASVRIPLETLQTLYRLAEAGASVVFVEKLPSDVPGLSDLATQRKTMQGLIDSLDWRSIEGVGRAAAVGKGRFLLGDHLNTLLQYSGIRRESMTDTPGLTFIRRAADDGVWYFITHQDEKYAADPNTPRLDGWITLATAAKSVVVMDPMTGKSGKAATRTTPLHQTEVYVQLDPGQSVILYASKAEISKESQWEYDQPNGQPATLEGTWKVQFVEGGPELPAAFETTELASWTTREDAEAKRFAGSARYTIEFQAPTGSDRWQLDLGRVCESASVTLNGQPLGTLFCQPFRIPVGTSLKPGKNTLVVEVTNLSANRIRSLDQQKVNWKYFNDINMVNIDYKPLDASEWPLRDSGLLGPVRLIPLKILDPSANIPAAPAAG